MAEQVILVDQYNQQTGVCEKLMAHQQGLRHRAFSVMVRGWDVQTQTHQWLMQQRAVGKYHCGGLWANACCSHPRPQEDLHVAVVRRLNEELGIDVEASRQAQVQDRGIFEYAVALDAGMVEHEIDAVFVVDYDNLPAIQPNPQEISAYVWIETTQLEVWLAAHAESIAPWLQSVVNLATDV